VLRLSRHDNLFDELAPGYEGVGEYYDLFADDSDIPFFLRMAKEFGSPVLDLASGSGRVAFPLAEAGFEVVALESSQSMLNAARRRLDAAPKSVRNRLSIVEGDMRSFDLGRKFALVIVPNSFGHALSTDSQISTLECVRRHLAEDGVFVLDLFPGALQHEHASFEDRPVSLPDGRTVSRKGEMHMDPVRQLLRVDLTYAVRDSAGAIAEMTVVTSGAAVIFNREADLLVRIAGLKAVSEYGNLEGGAYSPTSNRRILVLKKK
jgi:SAM-dependent methyltransferase